MKSGVHIKFGNLSFKKRFSIWWSFTLSVLFKKSTKTKYKVEAIDVYESTI